MNLPALFARLIIAVVCTNASTVNSNINCTCEYRPEVDWVGPYCSKWIAEDPPFCYLSGGEGGKFCPGAVKSKSGNFYWTDDVKVCEKNEEEQFCNCHSYDDIGWVGPYCSNWVDDTPFCILFGGAEGYFCPGSIQWGNESIY